MSYLCFLPWKKSNLVLSKAKAKASVQSFCFMLKLSPSEPMQPALGPSSCTTHMVVCFWARECLNEQGECRTLGRGERERKRERERSRASTLLFPWGYNQELFQNDQSTSQVFKVFLMGLPLSQSIVVQARLTGLLDQAPPPVPF